MLKSADQYAFSDFVLDAGERTLSRAGAPVEVSARYFDALALLVREQGRLVTKDRFMDEVWRGVPVTDEALTQCIRTLRKLLDDDAVRPTFIETVPKHGYRFIAPVESPESRPDRPTGNLRNVALLAGAGTVGGGLAGLVGGTLYGLAAASGAAGLEIGGVSILLVLMCVTIAIAALGAAGVSAGIALASTGRSSLQLVVGGALGGLVIGLVAKLVMIDSFKILFGQAPGDITGAIEGLILGGAVGLGAALARRSISLRRAVAMAAACGAAGGLVIALLGRPLMAGSLARLADLPNSRLSLDALAGIAGEKAFGPWAGGATAILEGALFASAIVLAMRLAERQLTGR